MVNDNRHAFSDGIGTGENGQTSGSSVPVGLGAQTFTVPTGACAYSFPWAFYSSLTTQPVTIISRGGPTATWMRGTVTSCSDTTHTLVVNVTSYLGTGSHADWSMNTEPGPVVISDAVVSYAGLFGIDINSNTQLNGATIYQSAQRCVDVGLDLGGSLDNFNIGNVFCHNPNGTPVIVTTSASSNTISNVGSSFNFTVGTGLIILPGQYYQFYSTPSPANFIYGIVSSYNPTTGALVLTETAVGGSGTFNAWTVAAPGGIGVDFGDGLSFTNVYNGNLFGITVRDDRPVAQTGVGVEVDANLLAVDNVNLDNASSYYPGALYSYFSFGGTDPRLNGALAPYNATATWTGGPPASCTPTACTYLIRYDDHGSAQLRYINIQLTLPSNLSGATGLSLALPFAINPNEGCTLSGIDASINGEVIGYAIAGTSSMAIIAAGGLTASHALALAGSCQVASQ